jgi:hypothetical protein
MSNFFSTYYWMFLGLGWGFALVAILVSWALADDGSRDVTLALKSRDEKRDQVNALKQREPELRAEYLRAYGQIRKEALIVIEQTKALFEIYRHTVQKNSRYSDIEMILPGVALPPELAAPEPPPLLLTRRDERSEEEVEE